MQNRLTNLFAQPSPEARWQTDVRPELRLTWLAGLMLLPLVGIAIRVVYLQSSTAALFAKPFEQTFVSYESVPSRDGRLLSADGRVLATDRQQFTVKVHYRWLEEPADPAWLRAQALSRLPKTDRRTPALLLEQQQAILAERARMWQRLAKLAEHSPQELTEQRAKIQSRVEGIVKLVEQRRQQKQEPDEERLPPGVNSTWRQLWNRFQKAITTAPSRMHHDPLIIKEEQDYHPLLTGLSLQAVAEIESHPELYPGLQIETVSWRDYPQDSLAAHLVGIRKPLTAEDAEKRGQQLPNSDPLGYEVGDRIGQMGLERTYDQQLHGLRGERRILRNRRGEIIATELVRQPRSGHDVMLTLHAGLQERLEQLLDHTVMTPSEHTDTGPPAKPASAGASLVVLDVRTGGLIAAVSAPRFSLMELMNPTPEQWHAMNADPRQPFFHRAISMAVAPGSIFKAVTAVAFLESGQFDPDQPQFCQGFLDRPDQHRCYTYRHFGVGHGEIDLSQAICRSCNVYFFQGARQIGPGVLVNWAERFGIGQPTGIDLPGERSGNLPHPPAAMLVETNAILPASFQPELPKEPKWYPGDTLGLAIGQSRLTTTPLQMARMMAAIANDGFLVTPHLVKSIGPAALVSTGEPTGMIAPKPRPISGLTPGTLARVREGLEMVVAHPQGTGYKSVRMAEVKIAGKTGTAEVGNLPDHAWFAGYVPADRPKYAFAIVLEHAGSGGSVAGPIARSTVEQMLELRLIESDLTSGDSK